MKASKFTDAQKAFILKQGADGMPVADICRKAGISQATYFIYGRLSRCKRFDPCPSDLGCQHLSGVTRDAGAPKWIIRAA